jgi:cytoskeletal protein RodZ
MTARHQLRLGKRLGRDRTPIDATPAPLVGETLQAARERKGVDLYRAERDTKIRMRYLAALEDSDWDELPAPVYTKGFLRNYAIYLGLEPDEILDRWREEMEQARTATRVAVAPPPMPLAEPGGRRLTVSPAMIVAGFIVVAIALFFGYIGVQFMRFADVTQVALTFPSNVVSTIDAQQVTLQGTAGRGSLISITGPDGTPYSTTADEKGAWSRTVPLARGRNNFSVIATDPVTQRESTPLQLSITVPLPSVSPGASSSIAPPPPITMTLFGPANLSTTTDPNVTVSGTTTGTGIRIASTFLGAPPATPAPSGLPDASARASTNPSPSSSVNPLSSPSAPPAGPSADLTVTTGAFSQPLVFPVGHWRVTITAYATGLPSVAQDVEITVQPPPVVVHTLKVLVSGNGATLRVTADGNVVPGLDGVGASDGQIFTATAANEFCVRSNHPQKISVTIDTDPLGLLPDTSPTNSWIIRPGASPEPATSPC